MDHWIKHVTDLSAEELNTFLDRPTNELTEEQRDDLLLEAIIHQDLARLEVIHHWSGDEEFNWNKILEEESLLADAMEENCVRSVEYMLKLPQVDVTTLGIGNLAPSRMTPLMACVILNNPKLLQVFLDSDRINVNAHNLEGETGLHMATQHADPSFVNKFLTRYDININNRKSGITPLECAVQHDSTRSAWSLLRDPRIKINISDGGSSALEMAVKRGNYQLVQSFLRAGADPRLWSGRIPNEEGKIDLFHLAMIQSAKGISEVDERAFINIGRILSSTGIPPVSRPDIVQKLILQTEGDSSANFCCRQHTLRLRALRERRRRTFNKLNEIGRAVATLGDIARRAIFDRLRENNGEFKVDTDVRIIVAGQNLPEPCNKHLKYES